MTIVTFEYCAVPLKEAAEKKRVVDETLVDAA